MFARLSFQAVAIAVVIACARTPANTSTAPASAGSSPIREPECYHLSYRDTTADASSRLFPTWIELFAGLNSGAATSRYRAPMSGANWINSSWQNMAGDSLEIMFTGTAEGIRIHAARLNNSLSGRATWLTDLVGFATSSLELVGTRESCP
jgi:hypothetical protein